MMGWRDEMETKNRKATFKEEQETLKRICAKLKLQRDIQVKFSNRKFITIDGKKYKIILVIDLDKLQLGKSKKIKIKDQVLTIHKVDNNLIKLSGKK